MTQYDNLTDDELLRVADGQAGLIKALAERLEMTPASKVNRSSNDRCAFGAT